MKNYKETPKNEEKDRNETSKEREKTDNGKGRIFNHFVSFTFISCFVI